MYSLRMPAQSQNEIGMPSAGRLAVAATTTVFIIALRQQHHTRHTNVERTYSLHI